MASYASTIKLCENIARSDECWQDEFRQLSELSLRVQDRSDEVLRHSRLMVLLISLNTSIKIYKGPYKSEICYIINDALLMTALHPYQIFPDGKVLLLEPLQLADLLGFLSAINRFFLCGDEISKSSELFVVAKMLEWDYCKKNLLQRMHLMSFLKLNNKSQIACLNSSYFQQIHHHPMLLSFMLFSSGSTEQMYLNTCSLAVFSQVFMESCPDLLTMLHLSLQVIANIEATPVYETWSNKKAYSGLRAPSAGDYLKKRMQQGRNSFGDIISALNLLLSEDSKVNDAKTLLPKLFPLRQKWAKAMQKMLSAHDLRCTFPLTKMPIREHWNISAALMVVPSLLGWLRKDGPSPIARLTTMEDFFLLSSTLFDCVVAPGRAPKQPVRYKAKDNNIKNLNLSKMIWDVALIYGHALLDENHSYWIHSIKVKAFIDEDGTNKVLYSDPKKSSFMILTLAEFENMLTAKNSMSYPQQMVMRN